MQGPSTQLAAACSAAALNTTGKIGKQRIGKRRRRDHRQRDAGDQTLATAPIDDGAARHLADQRDDAADRQHEADIGLRPFLRRQVDRDERAESGLHVGDEEHEPVEPAQAARRGMRRLAARWLDGGIRSAGPGACAGSSRTGRVRAHMVTPTPASPDSLATRACGCNRARRAEHDRRRACPCIPARSSPGRASARW